MTGAQWLCAGIIVLALLALSGLVAARQDRRIARQNEADFAKWLDERTKRGKL